jgi:DNA-binding NarL/FixJ family response regulator
MIHYPFCEDKTLLMVDDDPQNRLLLVQIVEAAAPSMNILLARHGLQAIEILQKKAVDLILLDWEMPEMDGISFLHDAQKRPWSNLPIVMYTGAMTASHNLADALAAGAFDFLRKPADPIEIMARLNNVLQQKSLEQQRNKALQDLHEQEVLLLRQEINNYLILLAQKNQALQEVKDGLDQTSKSLNPKQLSNQIARMLEQDDYWETLLHKFQRTEPRFMQWLHQQCSSLSPAELRLALLLRLGMDNKAIAHLLNISAEGVKKSRYRLRKKLNLGEQDNLDKYLMEAAFN